MINPDAGFHLVDSLSIKNFFLSKKESGALIFLLSDNISSKNDFISSLSEKIPMDPPMIRMNNWDAASDSLSAGLGGFIDRALVIFWPNAYILKSSNEDDFKTACDILEEAVSYFNASSAMKNKEGKLAVFVGL